MKTALDNANRQSTASRPVGQWQGKSVWERLAPRQMSAFGSWAGYDCPERARRQSSPPGRLQSILESVRKARALSSFESLCCGLHFKFCFVQQHVSIQERRAPLRLRQPQMKSEGLGCVVGEGGTDTREIDSKGDSVLTNAETTEAEVVGGN